MSPLNTKRSYIHSTQFEVTLLPPLPGKDIFFFLIYCTAEEQAWYKIGHIEKFENLQTMLVDPVNLRSVIIMHQDVQEHLDLS